MTHLIRFSRALALSAFGILAAGGASAQATWDLDACTGGTAYVGCGGNANANGVTVTIKAYDTTSGTDTFNAATINSGSGWIGVKSKSSNGVTEDTTSPNHAIDNIGSTTTTGTSGAAYGELMHLQFSKAVDLSGLVAAWANDTGGDADFLVFRWNYSSTTPDPTITNFTANQLPTAVGSASNGWQLVASSDFYGALTQSITDNTYFSSHWLVSTALTASGNDAFKLGTVSASAVCPTVQTSTGGCYTNNNNAPEPASIAMVLFAGAAAAMTRRRRR